MKTLKLLMFAIGAGIICFGPIHTFGQVTNAQEPERKVFLREMLNEMGDNYGCYFTLEIGVESGTFKRSLEEDQRFVSGLRGISLKDELEMLSKTILNFTYSFDSQKPQIIHIMDARLVRQKNYPLNQIVDTLKFDGALRDLVGVIGQQGFSVSPLGPMDTRELQSLDYGTKVHVKISKEPVRDILTNAVPLKDRGRILWIAETKLDADDITFIRYLR